MGFSINTNVPSMNSNLDLNTSSLNSKKALASIATALRINSAADDASGMMISNRLNSQASTFGQEIMNANESIGMIQIADGAMGSISENMDKIRTLSVQASNATLDEGGKSIIQNEINALMKSTADIVNTTSYNGLNLLNNSAGSGLNLQVDSILSFSIDIMSKESAASSLDSIDEAMKSINGVRSDLGSMQNKIVSNINNLSSAQINTAAAGSQIKDIDFAKESENFSKSNLLSKTGSFVQSHANTSHVNMGVLL